MCDLSIRSGHLLKVVPRSPTRLCCRRGSLLVTIEGDSIDYQLLQGDELVLPRKGSTVIEGEATFRLCEPDRRRGILRDFLTGLTAKASSGT